MNEMVLYTGYAFKKAPNETEWDQVVIDSMQPNGGKQTEGARWLQNTQIDGSECIVLQLADGTQYAQLAHGRAPIKPAWRFIKRDETEFWLPSCNARKLGTKLVATYAYNASSHTYCCSLTPAYWMVYLGTEAFPAEELTEEEWELVDNDIRESECDEQSTYFNCSDVDRMKSEALPYEIDVDREDFEEDAEYDRKVEDCIRENFQANPGACTWKE